MKIKTYEYSCDAGSIRVNGVNIRNGIGDGRFKFHVVIAKSWDDDDLHSAMGGWWHPTDVFFYGRARIYDYDCHDATVAVSVKGDYIELFRNDDGDFAFVVHR